MKKSGFMMILLTAVLIFVLVMTGCGKQNEKRGNS